MEIIEGRSTYSRLLWWEVWNFMSIEHGKAEFDERNIINFKGYNDSGKSAMLRALDVLMFNITPNKQVEFIQDDKDYFRIMTYFDDGIIILRDKYLNGQSLYEMYKDNECIFSTKNGKALARVSEVPQPIQNYLGLLSYGNININSRSCFEKQIGVQTGGSENYKMFSSVLKSEEIVSAGAMLNNDKNQLSSEMGSMEEDIRANKGLILVGDNLTQGMIDYLKEHDVLLDTSMESLDYLNRMVGLTTQLNSIPTLPELQEVSLAQLDTLAGVKRTIESLSSIPNIPEVSVVSIQQLNDLSTIKSYSDGLDSIVDYPELSYLDLTRLDALMNLVNIKEEYSGCCEDIVSIREQLTECEKVITECEELMKQFGVKMFKCPNCGQLFSQDEAHVD